MTNEPLTINGLPAHTVGFAAGEKGGVPQFFDVTYIAYRGRIVRQVSIAPASLRGECAACAKSFRALTDAERSSLTVLMLRVAAAREGETLAAFAARAGSAVTAEATAVLNGLPAGQQLTGGRLLKVAKEEPYTPKPW